MIYNKTCTRCVNDRTVKKITFNDQGLCSHCTCFDRYKEKLNNREHLQKLFQDRLNRAGEYAYDAAVGFSGGKDSTYVLYKLAKEHGLKVKAFTLDNGFMSPESRNKIDRLVGELGVEHEYVQCDMELLRQMYAHITSRYLSPCIACSFLGYAVMIDYASKINARVCVHGRSPYQMFRGLSDSHEDVFRPFIDAGLQEEEVDLDALYSGIIDKIDLLVDNKLAAKIKNTLLSDATTQGYRDFVAYFLYHPYDQTQIVQFLEENTSWRVESEEEHFDCRIHHGALYLKDLIARRAHLMPEYSAMINFGVMDKETACAKMRTCVDETLAREELKEFCRYAGISYPFLMLKANLYAKRWW